MKIVDLTGQKIGLLTIIERAPSIVDIDGSKRGTWRCLCDCGNEVIKMTRRLQNPSFPPSCGCKVIEEKRKFSPQESSLRRIWKSYFYLDKKRDQECNLTFEQFNYFRQQNCFYCGEKPFLEYNLFNEYDGSKYAKENGYILFNGLDRIDSNLSHTIDNVVSCCHPCNIAKSNQTQEEFIQKVLRFRFNEIIEIKNLELPNNRYLKYTIKMVYRHYNDSNLTLEEFYYLSQLPCFYCGAERENKVNKARKNRKNYEIAKIEGNFEYNGLDRVDSNFGHSRENVVPCCRRCNFAKGNQSLESFQEWMSKIQSYQLQKLEEK